MTSPRNIELSVLRWAPPIIHGHVRDLRVRWALEEAGLPYREHLVSPQDQKGASYRAWQPFGQVPALRIDGLQLFESGAIVQHIAEQSPALMPEDPQARTDVKTWLFAALNSVETPIYMFNILDMIYGGPKGDDYQALKAWVVAFVESRLDALVQVLGDKEYLLGRFTAADVLLTCVLRILFETDLVEKRPKLHAYQQRCEARPAFQKALADQVATFEKHAPA